MTHQKFTLDRQRNAEIAKLNDEELILHEKANQLEKARDKDMLLTAITREEAIK